MIEKEVGHVSYGVLYFLSGIGGNLLSLASRVLRRDPAASLGASGAVSQWVEISMTSMTARAFILLSIALFHRNVLWNALLTLECSSYIVSILAQFHALFN